MEESGTNQSLNEVYLFHGTSSNISEAIVNQGFDERVCNLSGLYGAGIYFGKLLLFLYNEIN